MSGRKLRKGFVPLNREGIRWVADAIGRNHAAGWTLVRLMGECDHKTGVVPGSLRWLSGQLEMSRGTLDGHLEILEEHGLVRVQKGENQYADAYVKVIAFDILRGTAGSVGGSIAGSVGGPVAGPVGGSDLGPADASSPADTSPREVQDVQEVQDIDLRSQHVPPQPPPGEEEEWAIEDHPLYDTAVMLFEHKPLTERERRSWKRSLKELSDVAPPVKPEELEHAVMAWPYTWDSKPSLLGVVKHLGFLLNERVYR